MKLEFNMELFKGTIWKCKSCGGTTHAIISLGLFGKSDVLCKYGCGEMLESLYGLKKL